MAIQNRSVGLMTENYQTDLCPKTNALHVVHDLHVAIDFTMIMPEIMMAPFSFLPTIQTIRSYYVQALHDVT